MKLKTYHADSIEAALQLARVELGEEAMFLGSRKAPDEGRAGRFEVMFAALDRAERAPEPSAKATILPAVREPHGAGRPHWRAFVPRVFAKAEEERAVAPAAARRSQEKAGLSALPLGALPPLNRSTPARKDLRRAAVAPVKPEEGTSAAPPPAKVTDETPLPQASAASCPAVVPVPDTSTARDRPRFSLPRSSTPLSDFLAGVADEVRQLRREIAELRAGLPPWQPGADWMTDPERAGAYARLLYNDVEPGLAAELLSGDSGGAPGDIDTRLIDRIVARCRLDSALSDPAVSPGVVVLVGPAGAGKTTVLAKIVAHHGTARDRRVHLVLADPLRIGAVEHLGTLAELLEVPMTTVMDVETLPASLAAIRQRSDEPALVLIDTPGYGIEESAQAERLACSLAKIEGLDTHLVLSVTSKPGQVQRDMERFQVFRPAKLLFTRLDEAVSLGALINAGLRTELPLSFFSTGPRIPEDLVPATGQHLACLLRRRRALHESYSCIRK